MLNGDMGLKLVLSTEGDVALLLAVFVGAEVVRPREVGLETRVAGIVHVFIEVGAEMACQVLPVEMVKEHLVIEEVLLAEVAPGVRQNLGLSLVAGVTVVDMIPELLEVVQPLLTDEDQSAF